MSSDVDAASDGSADVAMMTSAPYALRISIFSFADLSGTPTMTR